MSDKRKPETIIRELRRLLLAARADHQATRDRLITERSALDQYRMRATKAEQDAASWKQRFDTLLLCLAEDVRGRMAQKPGIFGGTSE